MKKRYLIVFLILTFILEIGLSIFFLNKKFETKNDTVRINELVKEVEANFNNEDKYPKYYQFVIIDSDENVIYRYGSNLSETLNEAYRNSDTIVDIVVNSDAYKIIIKNSFAEDSSKYRELMIIALSTISIVQLLSMIMAYWHMHKTIIKPFDDMRDFAERVASGNLDIPLTMDSGNNFGAFTESFDIMRSELKKAKKQEAEAEKSKRELVARLSHDIKTPIASIMSVTELGVAMSVDDKEKERLRAISQKADQINTLVNNLFTITIEELDELSINPTNIPSYVVRELINNADYLNKSNEFNIPECMVYFDRLRLQQVFDNIFANSYKYANTNIEVESRIENEFLIISIKDYGDTITDNDIPLLFEKYNRGSNTSGKEGSGLGLYISKRFMEAMDGKIEIKNGHPGFDVLLYLRII